MAVTRIFLVSAPSDAEFLGYTGEHTSILYAAAVLWDAVKRGDLRGPDGQRVRKSDVRLYAWRALSEEVWEELAEALRATPPRLVCVSHMTATSDIGLRIAALTKELSPESVVVTGGPHEDDIYRLARDGAEQSAAVDISVAGQGEYPLWFLADIACGLPPAPGSLPDDFRAEILRRREELLRLPGEWVLRYDVRITTRLRRVTCETRANPGGLQLSTSCTSRRQRLNRPCESLLSRELTGSGCRRTCPGFPASSRRGIGRTSRGVSTFSVLQKAR